MSKKYKLINQLCFVAIAATIFSAVGCRKELNITPETFVSPESLYKDENGDVAGLTGVYRKLADWKNSDYYFVGEVGTDEGKTSSFVPHGVVIGLTMTG